MPRAGDAFLTGSLPLTNSPLDRITFDPFTSVFDVEAFIAQLEKLITDYIIPIIKDLTGIDLSFLAQFFEGIDLTSPGGVITAITNIVIELIQRILTPFGVGGDFSSLTSAFNELVGAFTAPMTFLGNLAEFVEHLFGAHSARLAALEAKSTTLNPVTDNCSDTSNLVAVTGTVMPTGWGAWMADARAVALYNVSPATERQGAGIRIKEKQIGQTRLHICSDTAMTNWAGLEFNCLSGQDTVAVVTGTGPTSGIVAQASLTMEIPTDSFWEIRYEPDDETSPTSNTFHVFLNGDEVVPLRWKDAGNIVIHGSDHLRVGVTLNGLNSSHHGFSITELTLYDWVTAAPQ